MQETQETWVPSLGWEDPLEEAMAHTCVCLRYFLHLPHCPLPHCVHRALLYTCTSTPSLQIVHQYLVSRFHIYVLIYGIFLSNPNHPPHCYHLFLAHTCPDLLPSFTTSHSNDSSFQYFTICPYIINKMKTLKYLNHQKAHEVNRNQEICSWELARC